MDIISDILIRNIPSDIDVNIRLVDVFTTDNKTYLKIRRKELKQHAEINNARWWRILDKFYPYSKILMEKLYPFPFSKYGK